MGTPHSITISKRKALLAAGLVMTIGLTGLSVSGAYFTDQVTVTGNTATAATVKLGPTGDTTSVPIVAANLLPMTSTEADSKGYLATINVKNAGDTAIDWAVKLSYPTTPAATTDQQAFAGVVNIKPAIDGTASTAATLNTLATQTTPTLTGTNLAVGATAKVTLRMYLPETTATTFQGRSVPFTVRVRAIQAGAPTVQRDTDANYVTTP
jgi:hypothetical protein